MDLIRLQKRTVYGKYLRISNTPDTCSNKIYETNLIPFCLIMHSIIAHSA